MSSIPQNETTTLESELQGHSMSFDEYARWLSLLEGIEFVGQRVDQLKRRSIDCGVDWIKPLAFQKYIDERFLSMKSDLDEIEMNNKVKGPSFQCTTSSVPALA